MNLFLLLYLFCFTLSLCVCVYRENNTALSDLHHTSGAANEPDEAEPKTVCDLF